MSIGFKGQNALSNRISTLERYVFGIHPPDELVHQFTPCDGKTCDTPEGFPGRLPGGILNILQSQLPAGAPTSLLVNFEWTNGEGETFTWCCCWDYYASGLIMGGDSMNPSYYTSLVIDEDCTGIACEDCHEVPPCVITTPAPGGTLSFITGEPGSGTVNCTTIDAFNDGWNGMSMSIVHATTGVVAATYTGPPPGASPQTETPLTLDDATEYGIYINTKGDYPQENTIDIQQDGGTLLNHTFPTAEGGISDCSWAEDGGGGEGEGEGEP
jgi:hypothetical protein